MYRFAFCLADKAAVQNADGAEQSIDTGLQANQAPRLTRHTNSPQN